MKAAILTYFCIFTCALLNGVRCGYEILCVPQSMENIVFFPSLTEPPLCNDIERQFKHARELLNTCTRKEISIDEYEDVVKEYCDPKSDVRTSLVTHWNYLQNSYENCLEIYSQIPSIIVWSKINATSEVQKICERLYGLFATCLHDKVKTFGNSDQKTFARVIHAFKCALIGQCYIGITTEIGAIDDVRDDESIKKVCAKQRNDESIIVSTKERNDESIIVSTKQRNPDVEAISSGNIATANILCFLFVILGFYMPLVS